MTFVPQKFCSPWSAEKLFGNGSKYTHLFRSGKEGGRGVPSSEKTSECLLTFFTHLERNVCFCLQRYSAAVPKVITMKKISLAILLLLIFLITGNSIHAATFSWANTNGGDWNIATNWTPA